MGSMGRARLHSVLTPAAGALPVLPRAKMARPTNAALCDRIVIVSGRDRDPVSDKTGTNDSASVHVCMYVCMFVEACTTTHSPQEAHCQIVSVISRISRRGVSPTGTVYDMPETPLFDARRPAMDQMKHGHSQFRSRLPTLRVQICLFSPVSRSDPFDERIRGLPGLLCAA